MISFLVSYKPFIDMFQYTGIIEFHFLFKPLTLLMKELCYSILLHYCCLVLTSVTRKE